MTASPPIRDAATIILVRRDGPVPRVLMGQRGAKAVFMPSKFVFPGGALDPADRAELTLARPLDEAGRERLGLHADPRLAVPLALAAIRELYEETGLVLGQPGQGAPNPPAEWADFVGRGFLPDAGALDFIFRAVTPEGRPRRFDARFFLAEAADLATDPDDFSRACDELSHLHWVDLAEARALELPFITEIVLAEVDARLKDGSRPVPFFSHDGDRSHFRMLRTA
ncbi:NUDIX hydrolase [Roseobacter sp. HKCCA0434]|uniref:NUDIX hydrolase n=1 Tax=Roseobacter sp. HKCCA0434 TaxID=3079297 RepID=UPI002905B8C1|nr:NUDIX hydrolase [Roseobacter sp. HKCCA0434]